MNFDMLDKYLRSKIGVVRHHQRDWCWLRYLLHDKPMALINVGFDGSPLLTIRFPRGVINNYRQKYSGIIVEALDMPTQSWSTIYLNKIENVISDSMLFRLIDDSYLIVYDILPPKIQSVLDGKAELIMYGADDAYGMDMINRDLSYIIDDVYKNYDFNQKSADRFREKYGKVRFVSEENMQFLNSLWQRKNTQLKSLGVHYKCKE